MLLSQKVHFWRADEACNKDRLRLFVKLQRRADLLDNTIAQHTDAVRQRHGFHLIVGHIDHCRFVHFRVQFGYLETRLHA